MQAQGLEFDPQHPYEKPAVGVAHVYNPKTRQIKTEGPLGLTGQLA